jgi:oligo-1,6-glucosidase
MLLPQDERVYAYTRRHGDVELLVLGNFSGQDAPADVPDGGAWSRAELLLGNYPSQDGAAPDGAGTPLVLRPWETRVYRRAR